MAIWITTVIALILSAGAMVAGWQHFRKQLTSSLGAEKDELQEKIDRVTAKIQLLLEYVDDFASNKQLDSIVKQQDGVRSELEQAKALLTETETKLETAQVSVDEKESQQQELKSAKEDEAQLLDKLAAEFETVSQESVTLETQLAESLKHLDNIMGELEMTQQQRDIMQSLSNAMTTSSGRLRDLIMEYKQVNDRLEQLKQQHLDLEDEYTKLVEQQLGG